MQKFCRIALAVTLSLTSIGLFAIDTVDKVDTIPVLSPESQHATAAKRITAQFTRAHYKAIKIDDVLSAQIFDRYLKQLDYARNVFLATDIEALTKYREEFDTVISRGKLSVAYDIYNLNLQRRLERYEYALGLLALNSEKSPFDFAKDEVYNFDREDAPWVQSEAELDELFP